MTTLIALSSIVVNIAVWSYMRFKVRADLKAVVHDEFRNLLKTIEEIEEDHKCPGDKT